MIAKTLSTGGFNSTFHIFDSFEGLSDLGAEDTNARRTLTPEEVNGLRKACIKRSKGETRSRAVSFCAAL